MLLRSTAIAALIWLAPGSPVVASAAEGGQQAQVDVSRLPLNMERLERELRAASSREERDADGLRIRYILQIFGQAPPLIVFTKEDNLVNGPVPHGAPTHREILEHITPKEYRSPPADIGALIRWLQERAKK